jgi:predicted MFS family arabinose efflux permease
MTGPAIGGLLAQPSRGALGVQLPLLVAAGFALASALAVILFVREHRPEGASTLKRVKTARIREGFGHPIISRVVIISCVVVMGFAGIEATYGLWTEHRFGWGPRQIGLAFMLVGLMGAFFQGYLNGRLVQRYGEAMTLTGGLAFILLGVAVQGLSPTWQVAMLGFLFVCLGQSTCFPNVSALISRAAPPDRQGEMLGLNTSAMALSRIGGPVIAGQLFSLVAPGAPFAFSALMILPALWFAWAVVQRAPRLA